MPETRKPGNPETRKLGSTVIAELCILILLPVGALAQEMLLSERVVSAQAHQATIETVRQTTDAAGQIILTTNHYVELATGLNQSVLAGNHYPLDFQDRGSADALSSSLVEDLRHQTVNPPEQYGSGSCLTPQAGLRDTYDPGSDLLDLGYHYAALDYYWQDASLNGSLTLQGGVAVAILGIQGTILQPGKFYRNGLPDVENGELFVAHWYGNELQTQEIADDTRHQLEHALFAPLTIPFE